MLESFETKIDENTPSVLIISTQTPQKQEDNTIAPGSTDLALRDVTGGGFVYIHRDRQPRDQEREQFSKLHSGGWLIITGHGGDDVPQLQGSYKKLGGDTNAFSQTINVPASDYVNLVMNGSGLKEGDHINILLYVCYGAAGIHLLLNFWVMSLLRKISPPVL